MNPELQTAIQFQLDQVEEVMLIIKQGMHSMPRTNAPDEELLLAHNRILSAVLAEIAEVIAREPRRVYGGGLDQTSP